MSFVLLAINADPPLAIFKDVEFRCDSMGMPEAQRNNLSKESNYFSNEFRCH